MLVDAISREKSVERDVVFSAVELALSSAARSFMPAKSTFVSSIDRESGE